MDVPKIIARSAYGPETIAVMLKAFQDAWTTIEPHFYDCSISVEDARLALADEILAAAKEDSRDSDELKNLGLQAMAMRYRLERRVKGLEGVMSRRVYNARYWRSYARESLAIAERMTDPECKRLLIGIADSYTQLASLAAAAEAAMPDEMG